MHKLDIFNHFFPPAYFARMLDVAGNLGPSYIRETIAIIDKLDISANDRARIYHGNAEALLRLAPRT